MINIRIEEAFRLAGLALDNSKTTYQLSSWLPEFSSKSKPGETEVMLFTCQKLLEDFLAFCKQGTANRKLKTNRDKGSMLDVFPSQLKESPNPLMIIDQNACDYILENLYRDALSQGFTKFNVHNYVENLAYYSDVAKNRRRKIQDVLVKFSEIVAEENNNPELTWDKLLNETDLLKGDLASLTPFFSKYCGEQKSDTFCNKLHTVLHQQACHQAPKAYAKHYNCK